MYLVVHLWETCIASIPFERDIHLLALTMTRSNPIQDMQSAGLQIATSRPPSYTTLAPDNAPSYEQRETTQCAPKRVKFQRTKYGIEILDQAKPNETRYYVGRYQVLHHPDVILHRGSDRTCPVVGQATFDRSDKDFVTSVGESAASPNGKQEIARCIGNNKLFGHDGYQFTVPADVQMREGGSAATSLIWKHTHDSHLGSSMWRPKDFKLVDEHTGEVMAVYNNLSETDSEMGKLDWKVACSTGEEMRAIIVLMAMFERIRRSKKQASRAAVVSAAQGPSKGKIY
jgi:hypothetical protein